MLLKKTKQITVRVCYFIISYYLCYSTALDLLSNHKNIWKDITMKEMTSSNQTSFSLNLKSFFKSPFGAATDKINNKSFVQCLVQENVLLVILSNLTALYAWQCSDVFQLAL